MSPSRGDRIKDHAAPAAMPGVRRDVADPVALIGTGPVWHRRLRPAANEFRYDAYFLMLPMRQLRAAPQAALCRNRFGLISFHDRDHGQGGDDALAWIEQLLQSEGVPPTDSDGEIWLQTLPRVLGHTFKPVSFWWIHRRDGQLTHVLAEVNNTFGDRHAYLLSGPALARGEEVTATKVFHVSPFCKVEGRYRFRFQRQADRCLVRIDHDDAEGPLLQTSQGGRLAPLTPASRRRAFFGLPLMTLAVVLRIHWHALRLWLRRVPVHRRPSAPAQFVSRS